MPCNAEPIPCSRLLSYRRPCRQRPWEPYGGVLRLATILEGWFVRFCAVRVLKIPAASSPPLVSGGLLRPWPAASFSLTRPRLAIDWGEPEVDRGIVRLMVVLDRGFVASSPMVAVSRDEEYPLSERCCLPVEGERFHSPRAKKISRMEAAAVSTHEEVDSRSAMVA